MAMTLLITFPNNGDGEHFVQTLDKLQCGTYDGLTDEGVMELADLLLDGDDLPTMDAMVARPTRACRCTTTKKKGDGTGFTRTPKFGWFVHAKCMRPAPAVVRNFIANRIMGLNDLLPGILSNGTQQLTQPADGEVVDIVQRLEMRA